MSKRVARGPSTVSVHGREPRAFSEGALSAPISQSATFGFEDTQALCDYFEGKGSPREEYGRYGNPTVRALETHLAALEGAQECVSFSSGMSAISTTVLALVRGSGGHVVLFSDCYRRTRQFVTKFLGQFGVAHTLVAPGDLAGLKAALRPETRLIITEMPTNPYLSLVDLAELATIARAAKVKTLIDATFATPMNLKPLEHGIDIVLHSTTKYIAGHNDVLGGAVCASSGLASVIRDLRGTIGGIPDPHAAYLTLRGAKTLSLRVAAQNRTALELARTLEGHPRIARVWYPALPSHSSYPLYDEYMRGGGGVVTFELADASSASRFVDALEIPRIAPSLGGVESLVEQPALMSYYELSPEERQAIGVPDSLIRYAVGVEDADDIISDVLAALAESAL